MGMLMRHAILGNRGSAPVFDGKRLLVMTTPGAYQVTPRIVDTVAQSITNLATINNFYNDGGGGSRWYASLLNDSCWYITSGGSTSNASYTDQAKISASNSVSNSRYYNGNNVDYGDQYSQPVFNPADSKFYRWMFPAPADSGSYTRAIAMDTALATTTAGSALSMYGNSAEKAAALCKFHNRDATGKASNFASGFVLFGTQTKAGSAGYAHFVDSAFSSISSSLSIGGNLSHPSVAVLSSSLMMVNVAGVTYSLTSGGVLTSSGLAASDPNYLAELGLDVWFHSGTKCFYKGWPNSWAAPLDISANATADFANVTYSQFFGGGDTLYMAGKKSDGTLRVTTVKINLTNGSLIAVSNVNYGAISDTLIPGLHLKSYWI